MAENEHKQHEGEKHGTELNGATPPGAARAEAAAAKEAAPADPPPVDRVTELTTAVAKLTEEKRELNDRLLRTAADYENFKRRSRREMDEAGVRGMEGILRELLPVLDNLDRALMAAPKTDADPLFTSLHQGVALVQKQFLGSLEKFQIKSFDAQGKAFDPAFHEAVAQVDSETLPPGSVAVVYQRGYTVGSRLLRPAMVAVVRPRAQPTPDAAPAQADAAPSADGNE